MCLNCSKKKKLYFVAFNSGVLMRTQSVSTSKIPVTAVSDQCVLRASLHISTTRMFYILFFFSLKVSNAVWWEPMRNVALKMR